MEQVSDIKKRMQSVSSIRKITKAMSLISSVKMRQSKKLLQQTVPFFSHAAKTMLDLTEHSQGVGDIWMNERVKEAGASWRIGYYVMTGDQGMAGAYNHDVISFVKRLINIHATAFETKPYRMEYDLKTMGKVGRKSLIEENYPVDLEFSYDFGEPNYYMAGDLSERMMDLYGRGIYDEIFLIYSRITGPMTSEPVYTRLLPIDTDGLQFLIRGLERELKELPEHEWFSQPLPATVDFSYEPDETQVLNYLIATYLNGLVYGALAEAYASEQTARMTSMEGATKNSNALLMRLEQEKNRLRQYQITLELNEIVSGAESIAASEFSDVDFKVDVTE